MRERVVSSLILDPEFPGFDQIKNSDRLGNMVLLFGNAFVARDMVTDVEFGKLLPQKMKTSEQLKHQWKNDVCAPFVDYVVDFVGVAEPEPVPGFAKIPRSCWNRRLVVFTALTSSLPISLPMHTLWW